VVDDGFSDQRVAKAVARGMGMRIIDYQSSVAYGEIGCSCRARTSDGSGSVRIQA
jgi:hypothetical protein